jgi:16S rRNA (guanine966-N2)-methyltransferase
MRVIAGSAKGRRLVGPDTRETRPLTDRAKEGIFSAIGDEIVDVEFLDLYAGSGAIGIEALSRGARRATFVETSPRALAALRQNLAALGFGDRAVVSARRVADFLGIATDSFSVAFIDPPWSVSDEVVTGELEATGRITTNEIVLHRRRSSAPSPAPPGWVLKATYRYGDSLLLRYAQQYGVETERH